MILLVSAYVIPWFPLTGNQPIIRVKSQVM